MGANPDPAQNDVNAIHLARTPFNDRILAEYPATRIATSGEDVGLPAGVMGNSEVGHQNLGAGRIVDQELMRIRRKIQSGEFFRNEALIAAAAHAIERGSNVHVMGLASDAGVHSALDHLYAVVDLFGREQLPGDRLFVHAFGDGRDSAPDSGVGYIAQVEAKLAELGVGRVASVVGRFYAMDRDNRWERVEKAYRLLTRGDGHRVETAEQAFRRYYDNPTDPSREGDEFIEPTLVNEPPPVRDGDVVVFFNFRGDRPRELTKAFTLPDFDGFDRGAALDLRYLTMTEYEKGLPVELIFGKPPKLQGLLGEHVSGKGLTQFRCAETEKYPHVTFFFNDYREEPFDGEDRALVPSPRDVATYDLKPEMSALEVTEACLARIAAGIPELIVLNYANCDMVGHTGSLAAAIRAAEVVDRSVERVVEAVLAQGGAALVTADHGNAEQMVDPASGRPHTAHTTYEVDLIVVDPERRSKSLRSGGRLADVAPTALELMGLDQPAEMDGQSLLT